MAELESVLEQRLIDQLCSGDSQWTYRPDIRNEEDLWQNFKYILEQNNKAKLNDIPLSDTEFAKIKNDVSHSSFYDAGKWLVGENGRVYVHVQRGNETLHLVVMNNEHIAGGTSTYEVINQFQAFKTEDDDRDRRFDVSLLINGIPLIHIELKNKDHAYHDGFHQVKKYIDEGKFHGIFSNIQMFVVSNAIDTKYFAAGRSSELKTDFMTGWVDNDNQPVGDYLEFAKVVLKIPEAHEMVARYTVLDNDAKKLLILRPYQIHAIEAMRNASKRGESGFIWHTTGSGKTMTSYKATRNLLMDIPSIDMTVFLIDRKDLDQQTSTAFKSYANNDTIDVDNTEYADALIKKLSDGNRRMIVTTIQKMQIMINKKLKEGTPIYDKIRNLRVAFVVDECHRAVTPLTKRIIERFFSKSLWYGFTGTPIFPQNSYEQKGDLPQTTEEMYGKVLHKYTIKNAIHDNAVLGFMIENLGTKGLTSDEEAAIEGTEGHMRNVLNVVLNQSYAKLGLGLGRGKTFEGILTVSSIAIAQKYYEFIKKVKNGEDKLKIDEDVLKALPDFPKFAITYSISENEESSKVNQDKMKESLKDYNEMFGTNFGVENIQAYNTNLNKRLGRKESTYNDRSQQLDLVIVVDRLLTGFDAPCLSTIFIDRQPIPQNLIQAFSRTNRLYNEHKKYGQVVTFQAPNEFKVAIDEALKLYSNGEVGNAVAENWDDVKLSFEVALKAIRDLANDPKGVISLSRSQKKMFVHLFRDLDRSYAHLKAFSTFEKEMLEQYPFSEDEYVDWAAVYKNVVQELKDDPGPEEPGEPVRDDYELIAFNKIRVDYEYIVELIRGFVDSLDESDSEDSYEKKLEEIQKIISEYAEDNPKLAELLEKILTDITENKDKYKGQDVTSIINDMRYAAIDNEIMKFAKKWFIPQDIVKYEAYHFRYGALANETKLKESADYSAYSTETIEPLPKFRFRKAMIEDFKEGLMTEIGPLLKG